MIWMGWLLFTFSFLSYSPSWYLQLKSAPYREHMFKEDDDLQAHLDAPLELKLGGVEMKFENGMVHPYIVDDDHKR